MIEVLVGDLLKSEMQTLVNTVNCVGVMGKGIALAFKEQFPQMFDDYASRCKAKKVKLGKPYLFCRTVLPWILNFPTKDHWRSVARLQDIVAGLEHLEKHYKVWGIKSLAVPPLGCGEGQLEWRIVGPTLYRHLMRLNIPVELYAPYETPHEELRPEFLESVKPAIPGETHMPGPERVKPAWVALIEILKRIEDEPYHWPIGRTIFQKIAYAATEVGLPTGFSFRKGSFGPFSPEVKGAISRLVNNGLVSEEQLNKMFVVKTGPSFEDARKVYSENITRWEPQIDKVADLFKRTRTRQAETVATVLFAARLVQGAKKGKAAESEILREVMQWKQRRRPPLSENEVAYTIRNLAALGWLEVTASADLPIGQEAIADA